MIVVYVDGRNGVIMSHMTSNTKIGDIVHIKVVRQFAIVYCIPDNRFWVTIAKGRWRGEVLHTTQNYTAAETWANSHLVNPVTAEIS